MTDKEQSADSVRSLAAAYWEQDTDEDARLFAEQPVEWLTVFAMMVLAAHAADAMKLYDKRGIETTDLPSARMCDKHPKQPMGLGGTWGGAPTFSCQRCDEEIRNAKTISTAGVEHASEQYQKGSNANPKGLNRGSRQ